MSPRWGLAVVAAVFAGASVVTGLGAEPQRARQGAPPRDVAVPRRPAAPVAPKLRLTAERAQAFVDAAMRRLDYLPGEVIVKFRPFVSASRQQRALNALRGRPDVRDLEWHGSIAVARDRTQPNAHILAQQLSEQPEVAYAEPNYIGRVEPRSADRLLPIEGASGSLPRPAGAPNDVDYAAYQWNFSLLNMPAAWDIQPGARPDIIVAVVDTGITAAAGSQTFRIWTGSGFEDVSMSFTVNGDLPASRLVAARDFSFLDPGGPVLDMDGHGTHVSGTIGESTNNTALLAGMAYNARIMPIKVCNGYWEIMIARAQSGITGFAPGNVGGCLYSDMAEGIYYAANNGAKVMNISIGGPGSSTALRDALSYAVSQGVFVSISMGNDYLTTNEVSYPARYGQDIEGVMAVGAVGKTLSRAYYSSTGPHCEIAAPGGDGLVGGGADAGFVWQSTLFTPDQFPSMIRPRFDRYQKVGYQGTSMAAPHVAGLAALLAAQSPSISAANIERIIRATAQDLGAPGKDDSFGHGLIQPRTALFGHGIRR